MKCFLIITCLLSLFQIGEGHSIHQLCQISNQKIVNEVIQTYLHNHSNSLDLFSDIDLIGKEILQRGFDLSCYTYQKNPVTHALSYIAFPLWEGDSQVNLICLLFIWPSEQEALKYSGASHRHKTTIHSHPIPCAYTVLSGSITESYFTPVGDGLIRFKEKHRFKAGEKAVDLNQTSFIHQLGYEDEGTQPAVTLHVYGCSTFESFHHILEKTASLHEYSSNSVIKN